MDNQNINIIETIGKGDVSLIKEMLTLNVETVNDLLKEFDFYYDFWGAILDLNETFELVQLSVAIGIDINSHPENDSGLLFKLLNSSKFLEKEAVIELFSASGYRNFMGSCIIWANSDPKTLKALIKHFNIDINNDKASDTSNLTILEAECFSSPELSRIKFLVNLGAQVNKLNTSGQLPLEQLVDGLCDDASVYIYMLDKGAKFNLTETATIKNAKALLNALRSEGLNGAVEGVSKYIVAREISKTLEKNQNVNVRTKIRL